MTAIPLKWDNTHDIDTWASNEKHDNRWEIASKLSEDPSLYKDIEIDNRLFSWKIWK